MRQLIIVKLTQLHSTYTRTVDHKTRQTVQTRSVSLVVKCVRYVMIIIKYTSHRMHKAERMNS